MILTTKILLFWYFDTYHHFDRFNLLKWNLQQLTSKKRDLKLSAAQPQASKRNVHGILHGTSPHVEKHFKWAPKYGEKHCTNVLNHNIFFIYRLTNGNNGNTISQQLIYWRRYSYSTLKVPPLDWLPTNIWTLRTQWH